MIYRIMSIVNVEIIILGMNCLVKHGCEYIVKIRIITIILTCVLVVLVDEHFLNEQSKRQKAKFNFCVQKKKMPPRKRVVNYDLIDKLVSEDGLGGYTSPTSGRITYNKILNKSSFAQFSDIISAIIPLEIVNDSEKTHILPSIARVLRNTDTIAVFPKYLYINTAMEDDDFMDYETEEDQDNMDRLIEYVDKKKKIVIGITIQKSEAAGSAHASAFIVWKSPGARKYKFAFYDPLSYRRGKQSYEYLNKAFTSDRFVHNKYKIEFINLNKYCLHKDKENYHCVQYVINAEYCYIYSLYFLKKFIDMGGKTGLKDLKNVVTATYIVDPVKLTRANNKDSMIYRLIMISFVCWSLRRYLVRIVGPRSAAFIGDIDKNIEKIDEFMMEFKDRFGMDLKFKSV